MEKLTEFGRMKRRIKRELDAARAERALAIVQTAAILSMGAAQVNLIKSTIITGKMVRAASEAFSEVRVEREEERLP